jgi:hypothetical protein
MFDRFACEAVGRRMDVSRSRQIFCKREGKMSDVFLRKKRGVLYQTGFQFLP